MPRRRRPSGRPLLLPPRARGSAPEARGNAPGSPWNASAARGNAPGGELTRRLRVRFRGVYGPRRHAEPSFRAARGACRCSNRRSQKSGHGASPQMCRISSLHSLGTRKLSRLRPQGLLPILHQARSTAWGFVVNRDPQPVDKESVHSEPSGLSTGNSQDQLSCPQEEPSSPHLCPLFGNTTPLLTAESERRHTEVVDWAVGNRGKAGDGPGEKYPCPVHRVCRTFVCPQKCLVIHGLRPQARWTKNRL